MSLVTTINFTDITRDTSGGNQVSEFTQNSNVTYNGSTINTHRIRTTSTGSSTHITFSLDKDDFNNVLKNDNDLIRLNFDVYVKNLNDDLEIAECSIDGDVVLYQKGFSSDFTKKISVNYLIKSSRIAKLLDNDGFLVILFKLYSTDNQQRIGIGDYIYIDREIKVYAIYKPEFSSITGSNRTVDSTMTLDDSFDASSKTIANANACEIKGPGTGTSSGSVKFNLTNKLLDGKPINLFFNLNIDNFQNTDSLKIQIDNGSGTYVDYFEISQTANNNKLKTFFYSQTENYNSSNDFNIKFNLSGNIENGDFVYFDNMFTYIPEAINFFDGDVSVNGNVDVSGLIYKTGMVGEIGMFYEESPAPPFGYLWCDGTQITTNSSTTGGDEKYRNLIELLKGVNKNSTTGTQSAYLPDFSGCYALGSTSTFQSYSNVNNAISNKDGDIDLDINYFPSHNHSLNNINYTNNTTTFDSNISINHNSYTENTISYTETDNSKQAGRSGSGGAKNLMRLTTHAHNLAKNSHDADFHYNININYDNNQLSVNDISVENSDTNNTINVQPLSYKLKAAICYL